MKILIVIILIFVLLGGILFFVIGNFGKSEIRTIRNETEKVNAEFNLNDITKKADFKIEIFLDDRNLSQKIGEKTLIEARTEIYCKIYQTVFFDPDAEERFKELGLDFKVNFLEDYDVTKAIILLKVKETDEIVSQCEITGPDEEDIKIEYKKHKYL